MYLESKHFGFLRQCDTLLALTDDFFTHILDSLLVRIVGVMQAQPMAISIN